MYALVQYALVLPDGSAEYWRVTGRDWSDSAVDSSVVTHISAEPWVAEHCHGTPQIPFAHQSLNYLYLRRRAGVPAAHACAVHMAGRVAAGTARSVGKHRRARRIARPAQQCKNST